MSRTRAYAGHAAPPGFDPVLRDLAAHQRDLDGQAEYEAWKDRRTAEIYQEIIQGHHLGDALGWLGDASLWAGKIQSLESLGTQMTALTQALDAHSPDLAVAVATSPQTIPSTADATPAPVANSPTPAPAQQQAPADPAQTPPRPWAPQARPPPAKTFVDTNKMLIASTRRGGWNFRRYPMACDRKSTKLR